MDTPWKHPESVMRIKMQGAPGKNGPHCSTCKFKHTAAGKTSVCHSAAMGPQNPNQEVLPGALGLFCCLDWKWDHDP